MSVPPPVPASTAAVVLAAGSGTRAGGEGAKQFRMLGRRSVLARSVAAFLAHEGITSVVVVIAEGAGDAAEQALGDLALLVTLVTGAETRRGSVRAALEHLAAFPAPPSRVLVHDSARPGLAAPVIDRLLAALANADAAMPVLPVVDTLLVAQNGAVADREGLRRVQTPQAFDFSVLLAAHRAWRDAEPTDDAQMVRAGGIPVALVEGDPLLDKITLPGDHARMATLLDPPLVSRTGMGFDVHRLEPGGALWLCGVEIPHSHGLAGHSDADVAIHALVDAILGALAEGDIGTHFPPSDPQWRGAPSARFLAFAAERVTARGGILDHVDLTLICEAPRIGPHRAAMRARLAEILGLCEGAVSVKATTTERLGFTGRGEGIAAQALVSLRLPVPA